MNNQVVSRIVVVGGGSAGWITAGTIAARSRDSGLEITLIESPDVSIIGVGEGTWPSMRATLQTLGIDEMTFLRECDATFKQGSSFIGWANEKSEQYYHPFSEPYRYQKHCAHSAWQASGMPRFVDAVGSQGKVCDANLAPKQLKTPPYAGVVNYGYHLDAAKFADLLARHCTQQLGVRHIKAHVSEIENDADGYIRVLHTVQSGAITGDLFIDCSGMSSKLLGEHYGVPFEDKRHILFNDSAIAAQVPYPNPDSPIPCTTQSSAHDAGWVWDIGLQSRRGVGVVYASDYMSDEQAHQLMLKYLSNSGADNTQSELRQLRFRPGHRREFWHKNCLAIGLSAGFVEPLEASALALVELSVTMLNDDFPRDRRHMQISAKRFNQRFTYRWERTIEFLKLHYAISQRGSRYWQDNRNPQSIPEYLRELLELWQYQPPSRHDLIQNEEVFPSASYQYVLYGMGFNTRTPDTAADAGVHRMLAEVRQQQQQYLQHLPTHRALLDALVQNTIKQSA